MTPSLLHAGGWFQGLFAALRSLARAWSGRPSPFVTINPAYASLLRAAGLTRAEDFLALPEIIISGHPDRQVSRVTLGSGVAAVTAFLKREHRVPWKERVANARAGFGPASKSLREARILQTLPADLVAAPEWIAAGEAPGGRAFVLVRELPGAIELCRFLAARKDASAAWRRHFLRRLAAILARLHGAGFVHGDLYANHILVAPETEDIHLVDWQRARSCGVLRLRQRWSDLAALAATLTPALAGTRERLTFLRTYLQQSGLPVRGNTRQAVRGIADLERGMSRRRHIRAKRLPPLPADSQCLTCLDGEALNVTRGFLALWPAKVPDGITGNEQDARWGERKLALPDGGRGILVWTRRWQRHEPSPERVRMSTLFRLQRYGIEAPRVLAVGDRLLPTGEVHSFLLTRPPTDTQPPGRDMLKAVGAFLARLHEAGCYFRSAPGGLAIQVRTGEVPRVVLETAEGLVVRRHFRGFWKRKNLLYLLRALAVQRTDRLQILHGYREGRRVTS